jgi:hypothetical protein
MYRYNVNAPLKNVAANAADLITPHPSPRRHLPLKGKARAKLRLRAVVLTASVDATSGTDKSVPYRVQAKFCTNIAQLPGVRNDTVSTAASNRDTAKKQKAGIGSPLKKRNNMVYTNVPNRDTAINV